MSFNHKDKKIANDVENFIPLVQKRKKHPYVRMVFFLSVCAIEAELLRMSIKILLEKITPICLSE